MDKPEAPTGAAFPEEAISPEEAVLPSHSEATKARGPLAQIAYVLGGAGLLAATTTDSLAVAGRHTGLHLLGSIELVQAAVVLLATSAMLIATMVGGHASVHIVTERLPRPTAARLARVASAVSGVTFLLIALGSAWILSDLWNGHERTELLHLPLRWLRLLWIVFALLIAFQFFRRARASQEPGQ
ncbi:TRAP transporter small permease subunit [Novosphingobium flavum]|uniref:TRAP transporter small permease protein n=1 Tax=Novosphingobium flavum TaxID=1778672 RepID=A0A7X1FR62_9SPHN|nr:TRAP transporter small permease subunit [Novosphingobium flavum]MBC2665423.1 TRAP transporter small permease subunit [Novosphingobium flavum]